MMDKYMSDKDLLYSVLFDTASCHANSLADNTGLWVETWEIVFLFNLFESLSKEKEIRIGVQIRQYFII
jgi:hypothetical protein